MYVRLAHPWFHFLCSLSNSLPSPSFLPPKMKQPFSRLLAPVTLLYFIASTAAAADGSVDVSIPLTAPSSAPQIAPDLLSFSIEQDRWVEWAGNTSKNTFFYNALNNLKQITGASPWVRIGADSEDHTNFDPSLEVCPTQNLNAIF